MAEAGAQVSSVEDTPTCTDTDAEKKEKAHWRFSPFASYEVGIAAKAPDHVLNLAHAMVWDPKKDQAYIFGQLLASAVVHGGLLSTNLWQAWLDGLAYLQEESELLWIDLNVIGGHASTYRWFADPTTRILIHKARDLRHLGGAYSAHHCLGIFLSNVPGACDNGNLVETFVGWAVAYWRLRLPPLLLDQALCRLPTVTISSDEWLGVLEKEAQGKTRPFNGWHTVKPGISRSTFEASEKWLKKFNAQQSVESKIFDEAWRLRSNGTFTQRKEKNFCARQLERALPGLSPGRQELIRWSIARLTQARARPNPRGFAASTVRQNLYSVLEGIYRGEYRGDDFVVTLENLNSNAEASLSCLRLPSQRSEMRLIQNAQRDLGRYLQSLHAIRANAGEEEELETLLDADPEDSSPIRTSVSAKIISPEIFRQAVAQARESSSEEAAIMIILGFRTGIRFKEIAGLQVHDFVSDGNEIFELHVQRHRHRELKTFNSRRIIPISLLLSADEQQSLRLWLEPRRRLALRTGKDIFCFGPVQSKSPIADRQKWVEKFLNNTFGEKCPNVGKRKYVATYNFAHLRHSFGSYLLASLMMPEDVESSLVPKALRDVVSWNRGRTLSNRLLGQERLGQGALHAVSQIMGHTGIYRTLESYQHLLDLVLGLYVNRRALQPRFPSEVHSSLAAGGQHGTHRSFDRSFGFGRTVPPRSRGRTDKYTVPVPPKDLLLYEGRSDWRRLDLAQAERSYGLTSSSVQSNKHLKDRRRGGWISNSSPQLSSVAQCMKTLDWNTVWTILTSGEDESEKLRASIALSDGSFVEWRRRYDQIMSWCFTRQSKRQSFPIMPIPEGAYALSEINWIWLRRRSQETLSQNSTLIKTFLSTFDESGQYGRFDTMSDAEEFAALLRSLGIDGRNITIARGRANDFKEIKAGRKAATCVDRGSVTIYKTWEAAAEVFQNPYINHRPVLWVSHAMHEQSTLGWSFDIARAYKRPKLLEEGGRAVHHKVNYAYRFILALMAIVDDHAWAESPLGH